MTISIEGSLWKSLVISLVPLIIGTLLFGMILESYKNELTFRSDIMKDYYNPLINKKRQCNNISRGLSANYYAMTANYTVMFNQYQTIVNGTGPRITEEYKIFLSGLLQKASELNEKSKQYTLDLNTCRSELYQLLTNTSLVTGTFDDYQRINKENEVVLVKLNSDIQYRFDKYKEVIDGVDVNKTLNSFFIFGDISDLRNSGKYTDEMINTVLHPMLDMFTYIGQSEEKIVSI
ncbi:hypothetical protein CS369_20965 [Candidatus Symbiopectobacterium sp. 'North America']|uniref:hypothetical protein n=1 Tax=Candidatus Symbiopectobacterium sp. 'North America' TaxID=2794574 RepID=UPI0018C98459|nr:hypothetical protein [Candidatus Symbiopectobacterium sp. 'North America']MBG6246574.1 hypothetical protein [Candidatus Symbiopectobacterium sp. 'North America']